MKGGMERMRGNEGVGGVMKGGMERMRGNEGVWGG